MSLDWEDCVRCGATLEGNYGGVSDVGPLCTECWTEIPEAEVVEDRDTGDETNA